jgi:hypothetical protein
MAKPSNGQATVTLDDLGISAEQADQAMKLATIPEDQYQQCVDHAQQKAAAEGEYATSELVLDVFNELFGPSVLKKTHKLVFRAKNQKVVDAAVPMLEAENPMTLRQLFYRLISAGMLHNKQSEYQRLGAIVTRLRECGEIPRSWIVDHVRARLKPSSWSGLGDFADSVRDCYRLDFWSRMPHHVVFLIEKDAAAGTVQPITEKYDIGLYVCRGYASVSFAGEIADELARIQKPTFCFYLGDFDPSGFDIERDLREKLERYSGRQIWTSGSDKTDADIYWVRLGVLEEDFDEFDLVRLPLKRNKHGELSDMRAAGFIAEHGEHCAEIDAIPPTELRRRVEEAILTNVDRDAWTRLQQIEAAEQETLNGFVKSLAGEKVELD